MLHTQKSIAITDRSSVGEARRAAVSAAQFLGFNEERRSNISIVATEAANNVLLHAEKGELLVCPGRDEDSVWLDLIALDSGGGIKDVPRAMEDGYSTVGTAGQGLGAIQRLSDFSSLYSAIGSGTAYWSRFQQGPTSVSSGVGVVNLAVRGETVSGDSYLILNNEGRRIYMVVDGLGHGTGAAEAAAEAVATATLFSRESAAEILLHSHEALKKTRGAAMSLAIVEPGAAALTYAGIGNISALLVTGSTSKSLVSQNGTLGAAFPRSCQEYVVPFEQQSLLVMFSDGLTSKVSLSKYAGFQTRPPALLAALLHRDFTRGRDDSTVMVAPLGGSQR